VPWRRASRRGRRWLALKRINEDPNWRHAFAHGVWNDAGTLGDTTLAFKLEDAVDTDLADDAEDRAWLHGRARIGKVQRLMRVMLQPVSQLPDANRLRNAGMEAGVSGWGADADAELRYTEQRAHGGAGSLYLERRDQPEVGVAQTITGQVERDMPYYAQVWVRLPDENDGRDQSFKLQLYARDTGGTERSVELGPVVVDGPWQVISGTITPTWSGALAEAELRVVTESEADPFYMDDALLIAQRDRHGMAPIAGTWQQVVE